MMPCRRPTRPAAAAQSGDGSAGGAGALPAGGDGRTVVLDPDALQKLRELDPDGHSHLMQKVTEAFRASTGRLLPQMVEAASGGSIDRVRHVAHTLKSSSASLGALRLSRLCADLEQQIRVGEVTELGRQVEQIAAETSVVIKALDLLMDAPR